MCTIANAFVGHRILAHVTRISSGSRQAVSYTQPWHTVVSQCDTTFDLHNFLRQTIVGSFMATILSVAIASKSNALTIPQSRAEYIFRGYPQTSSFVWRPTKNAFLRAMTTRECYSCMYRPAAPEVIFPLRKAYLLLFGDAPLTHDNHGYAAVLNEHVLLKRPERICTFTLLRGHCRFRVPILC